MDLDRLTLQEAAQISKVVELLGTPIAQEEINSCIRVLDVVRQLYLRQLVLVNEANRQHG